MDYIQHMRVVIEALFHASLNFLVPSMRQQRHFGLSDWASILSALRQGLEPGAFNVGAAETKAELDKCWNIIYPTLFAKRRRSMIQVSLMSMSCFACRIEIHSVRRPVS